MKTLAIALLCLSLCGCATQSLPSPTIAALSALDIRRQSQLFPEDWSVPGDTQAKALVNLLTWAQRRYIIVKYTEDLQNSNGEDLYGLTYNTEKGWFVQIRKGMTVNTQFYTLLHELAHIYQAHNLTRISAEVFCELVAFQVSKNLNLDTTGPTALYLDYTSPVETEWRAALSYAYEVDVVVAMLTDAAKGRN